jgi:hypothetical protein
MPTRASVALCGRAWSSTSPATPLSRRQGRGRRGVERRGRSGNLAIPGAPARLLCQKRSARDLGT